MALILTYAQRTSMTGHGLLNYVLEAERAPDGAVVCVVDQVEHPDAAPGVHLRVYRGVMVKGPHVGRRVVIKGARTAAHLAHLQREAATYATLQHLQGDCIPHCVGLYTSPPTNEDAPQGCLVLVELDAVPSTAAALSQTGLVFFGTAYSAVDEDDSDDGYVASRTHTPTKLSDTEAMRAAIAAAEDLADYTPKSSPTERVKPCMTAGILSIPIEAWPKCLCAECRGASNVTPGPVWNGFDWERPAPVQCIAPSNATAGEGWLVTELTP